MYYFIIHIAHTTGLTSKTSNYFYSECIQCLRVRKSCDFFDDLELWSDGSPAFEWILALFSLFYVISPTLPPCKLLL